MLLTKVFAEAVAFLRLFDLSALAVTNKLCSSLTVKASTKIQWEEFPDRVFLVLDRCIVFGELELTGVNLGQDCSYLFSNETGMVDFVAAAFRNCIFEDSEISFGSRPLLDAFDRVADSVIVKGALSLPTSVSPDDSLKIVRSFRKVKALRLRRKVSEDEVVEIANFYRGSGLQELQYYPCPYAYPTPTTVALD